MCRCGGIVSCLSLTNLYWIFRVMVFFPYSKRLNYLLKYMALEDQGSRHAHLVSPQPLFIIYDYCQSMIGLVIVILKF